jgi:hypothetical protein
MKYSIHGYLSRLCTNETVETGRSQPSCRCSGRCCAAAAAAPAVAAAKVVFLIILKPVSASVSFFNNLKKKYHFY